MGIGKLSSLLSEGVRLICELVYGAISLTRIFWRQLSFPKITMTGTPTEVDAGYVANIVLHRATDKFRFKEGMPYI